jgi:xanthine dehydrogenase YagR molybdenum-binding subunit
MATTPPPPTPAFPDTALDANRQRLIGAPMNRVDGPLKVCGRAPYAYEYAGAGQTAYGMIVNAGAATGRIEALDTAAAERAPGVLLVLTHRNTPPQGAFRVAGSSVPQGQNRYDFPRPELVDDQVRFHGQAVAFVVAETFEQACAAAALVQVRIAGAGTPRADLGALAGEAYRPARLNADLPTDSLVGDADAAFATAPVQIDATYTTPVQHHNAMEPHASMAVWAGDQLTLYTSHQSATNAQASVAATLNIPKEQVRILCPYVGGGFGAKLPVCADAVLSALAARQLGRPVKTALTREQTFVNSAHRTGTRQHIRLGAERDGRLTSLAVDVVEHTSTFDEFAEQTVDFVRALYAAPNRRSTHRLVRLDLPTPGTVRAPGEGVGMLGFEAAMDELAHALQMDPIELRLRNEPAVHPEDGRPFSSRSLVACMREGARRFGWTERPAQPGSRSMNGQLVGYGMAAATRNNYIRPARARVRVDADGQVRVFASMTDIGTGSYTVFTQIAAEALGVPARRVTVELGDSRLPPTPGSGGSFGASSTGTAILDACEKLRPQMKGRGQRVLEAEGSTTPGAEQRAYSHAAHGAHFAEVRVDPTTGEVRLKRMLGVFAAGRILNAKTARSQAIGGLIWGVGSALHEETVIDDRWAFFVNHDLAEYHVPVHADAPSVDAVFLHQLDDKHNPLKIKGVGELGICGAGAAVNNAVFNACGVRVRDYPVTLDKVLAGMASRGSYG